MLGIPLHRYVGAAKGPAFGAARLAWLALGGDAADIVVRPVIEETLPPDDRLADAYAGRVAAFRSLYAALRPEFRR